MYSRVVVRQRVIRSSYVWLACLIGAPVPQTLLKIRHLGQAVVHHSGSFPVGIYKLLIRYLRKHRTRREFRFMGALDFTLILVPLLGVRTTYRPIVALAEVVLVELAHLFLRQLDKRSSDLNFVEVAGS